MQVNFDVDGAAVSGGELDVLAGAGLFAILNINGSVIRC